MQKTCWGSDYLGGFSPFNNDYDDDLYLQFAHTHIMLTTTPPVSPSLREDTQFLSPSSQPQVALLAYVPVPPQ